MDYEKILKGIVQIINTAENSDIGFANICDYIGENCPELKENESEDERIRKELLEHCKNQSKPYIQTGNKCPQIQSWITWLERQGQVKEYTFKSIPRLLDMIEPTESAKAYCQKLIDTLAEEGYAADAKIVCECLRKMCGEKVALATMDDQKINKSDDERIKKELISFVRNDGWKFTKLTKEEKESWVAWLEKQAKQKPYGQREECSNCQFNYAGHCKGYCELKRQDKSTFEQCKQESGRVFKNSDGTCFNLSQLERVVKAKTPEESLGISSEKYNEIVNECILGDDEKNSTQSEEQKPADKAESKFHEGDWIVNLKNNSIAHIVEVRTDFYGTLRYEIEFSNGGISDPMCVFVDDECRLWTIEDAKDGNVLAYVTDEEDLWIMIYRSLYKPYEGHVHYHALLVNDDFSDEGVCCIYINDLKPATKEQRDTLMKAITDSGYKWDAEKKELICLKEENSNDSDLEWSNMETKECHCYSCELYDRKNNNCKDIKLCKNPKNTYKGFYKKVQKKMKNEKIMKEIRDKIAHEIAWESTKHYDPTLSKENWCEMAAGEAIDRIGGGGENPVNYKQGYKDAIKDACRWLNDRYCDYGYLDLEDVTSMILELDK